MTQVQASPVEVNLDYDPMPKQAQFHASDAKYRFFVGGWGNGKTSAGCAEGLALALEYPGSEGLIFRRTRPELKATTQNVFFKGAGGGRKGDWKGCPTELIRSFNKTEQKLTLINDSVIYFWPMDDAGKLTNLNIGWFLIDQAEEIPEEMFMMLEGRLRQMSGPRKGMCLANPAGHDWIWRRCLYLEYPDHEMIHAKTQDNPNLPTDYIESLLKMPEKWRKRFMEGSFEVMEGQIWPEFDPDIHAINPFVVPDWWEGYETIDHGRRNPTAVLFAKFDDQGNCFIVDEHYEKGKLVSYHANAILRKREQWGQPLDTVIDASAAQEDPNTGRSVIDEYTDHGVFVSHSDRHVIARINRVAEWLQPDPNHPHPLTGETREEGWPRLYIFKNCVNLIEHLPQYQWKKQPPTKMEDAPEKPEKKDDHDVDALGYLLMRRPPPSVAVSPTDPRNRDSWYWERIKEKTQGKEGHSMLGTDV